VIDAPRKKDVYVGEMNQLLADGLRCIENIFGVHSLCLFRLNLLEGHGVSVAVIVAPFTAVGEVDEQIAHLTLKTLTASAKFELECPLGILKIGIQMMPVHYIALIQLDECGD
jgi:hypothetical protein